MAERQLEKLLDSPEYNSEVDHDFIVANGKRQRDNWKDRAMVHLWQIRKDEPTARAGEKTKDYNMRMARSALDRATAEYDAAHQSSTQLIADSDDATRGSGILDEKNDDFLYNVAAYAYDVKIANRQKHQIIFVESLTTPKKDARIGKLKDAANANLQAPLEPSEEEINPSAPPPNPIKAIVVGVMPVECLYTEKNLMKNEKVKRQSIRDLHRNNTLEILSNEKGAFRVVAGLHQTDAKFYALYKLGDDTNLYVGLSIETKSVFFFPEFRDGVDECSIENRQRRWTKLVRDGFELNEDRAKKQQKLKDANLFKTTIERSMSAQITSMGNMYYQTSSEPALNKLIAKLEELNVHAPSALRFKHNNANLWELWRGEGTIGEKLLEDARNEVKNLWPEIEDHVAEETVFMHTAQCLRKAGVRLKPDQMRMFVVLCADKVNEHETGVFDMKAYTDIARLAQHKIFQLTGHHMPTQSAKPKMQNEPEERSEMLSQLCRAVANAFEDAAAETELKLTTLKSMQSGDHILGGSFSALWQAYGSSLDSDNAKLFGSEIHRFNVDRISQIFEDVPDRMREQGKYFRQLGEEMAVDDEAGSEAEA